MVKKILVSCALMMCALDIASAQDPRGSITGRVADQQGAVVAGAAVTITNIETNLSGRTLSNESGYFEVNLLNAGKYTVTVEAAGFKKAVRSGLELNVAGRLDVAIQLQIGQLAETIEVTAEAPLLDTTSASGGRVIDNRQIMQLPFSDMNPFALSGLAAGMQWTGQPEYRRPFDNGGTSAFNTMGGVGQNEYTIDGAPVTGTNRRVGFVPPSDAVDEFKLETASFDASYGHTSGATINVVTKSGTNNYHGSLYDQHWQQRWNATNHFTRLGWEDQVRSGKISPDTPKQAPGRSNNFGGTAGGPVRIPKLFNGKDKLFFFFSYNGIYQAKAETTNAINRTVPKLAWRQGDFSDLLAIDATKYQIYDPRSAFTQNGHVTRVPFPGNKGIPILNPLYKFYEPLYPAPNNVPGLVSAEGTNNYLAAAMPKNEKFNSIVNRVDYNINDRHRLFGRWYWNHRLADEYDWTYTTKRGLNANGLTRINKGGGGDYIWSIDSRNILDISASWTRFNEGSVVPALTSYKPSDVGLPAYLDTKAGENHKLPGIGISGVEGFPSGYPGITDRGTTGVVSVQMTSMKGVHSLKYGFSERRYWFTSAGLGNTSGNFSFDNNYTKAADNTTTSSGLGLGWAAFMMGVPSGMTIDSNDSGYWSTRYRDAYLQDDWRVSTKLRVTLGLRYEREGGITERFNRGINGQFLFDAKLPFSDLVQAAYAQNALPELAASQFKVLGGTQYLGQGPKPYSVGTHLFLPRVGLVYQLNAKTVLRGGYGRYYDTFNVNNTRPSQLGFSQPTSTVMTTDNGLSFCCAVGAAQNIAANRNALIDPFPVRADGTRFETPFGNKLGLAAFDGRGFTEVPHQFQPAAQQRWRAGVQRELRSNMAIEVSYNGAFSRYFVNQRISALPSQYWATGNTRNQAVDDNLNQNVPNPFNIKNLGPLQASDPALYQYLGTQGFFTGTTIQKNRLLRAFPQMNGLSGLRPDVSYDDALGHTWYHDLQVQLERRFSRGFQSSVLYTYAYSRTWDYYLNEFDTQLSSQSNNNTRPHRFVWSSIYELPFGKGKPWMTSGPLQHILGGWQLSWIYQYQNGSASSWGSRFFYGDVSKIGDLFKHDQVHSKDIHAWFDPGIAYKGSAGPLPQGFTGFEGRSASQPGSYQVRTFPVSLDSLREDGIRNWDVKILRRFQIHDRLSTSFSVDLLNATNHTNFSGSNNDPTSPNFGRVTSQRGLPRVIQFNLRIDF